MFAPADIRHLNPEQYEYLWRTILRREHGTGYQHVDGQGVDCLTENDATAYQIYHHQGSPVEVVRGKLREDLKAFRTAQANGKYVGMKRWVFVSSYSFKAPEQAAWLSQQKADALPLVVETFSEEDLASMLAIYPDLAAWAGLASVPTTAPLSAPPLPTAPPAPKPHSPTALPGLRPPTKVVTLFGILWGMDTGYMKMPFCVGCLVERDRYVPMSVIDLGNGWRDYKCPLNHGVIRLGPKQPTPLSPAEIEHAIHLMQPTPLPSSTPKDPESNKS